MLPWACQVGLSFLLSCTKMFAYPTAAVLGQIIMMDMAAKPLPLQAGEKAVLSEKVEDG
jgi:hypothetical protein